MSTSNVSAAVPLQDALYARLATDAAFAAWRGDASGQPPRVYEVLAPPGVSLRGPEGPDGALATPYVTLVGFSERDLAHFGGALLEHDGTVRVWVPGAAERLAKIGYAHVRRLLHDQPLLLPGFGEVRPTVRLDRCLTDPDGGATQAIVVVTLTMEGAA